MDTPLAQPIGDLKDSYGVVVVGSGYGGSIVAARLAQGRSLCLLERGREWIPGAFPDEPEEVAQALRSELNPLGLYDYRLYDDVDVLIGCGLGGTSLINANVVIQPDDDVFDHPRWPAEIRQARDSGALQRYFARVRDVLKVERYPDTRPPLRKVAAHQQASQARGAPFSRLDVAVNLTRFDGRPNDVGTLQHLCILCGDCVTGCNVRAKNTLYMNYLPMAKRAGAQIFTQVEVTHLVKAADGGYHVHYLYRPGAGQPARPGVIHASAVVLAAGVLGSTEILLRSRAHGLALSAMLGQYFSGNGDILAMGYNTDQQTDILGFGNFHDDRSAIEVGPTILSMADYRVNRPRAERFIIEEGAIPRALVDAARLKIPLLARLRGEDTDTGDTVAETLRVARDLLRYDPKGALNHAMLYLGIGHDGADGTLVLDHRDRVRLLWRNAPDHPLVSAINAELRAHTAVLGGTYIANPRWDRALGHNLITVHPLGGCAMGADADSGVVDHRGRVFDPSRGAIAVHEGLFVADGAIIPTAVGVNPLLTISALAERIADLMQQDAQLDLTPKAFDRATYVDVRPAIGLEFTEEMKGHAAQGIQGDSEADFHAGERRGRDIGEALSVWLWIHIDDLDVFVNERSHQASVKGYIEYAPIGGRRTIERGSFNLFIADPAAHTKRMRYSLQCTGVDGTPYLLEGYKEIRDDRGWDAWADNTTLFTTVHRGKTSHDPVFSRGIIRVKLWDFLEQLTSFRVHNAPTVTAQTRALRRFGAFFFGELWDSYVKQRMPGLSDDQSS
jgi:cholesterol oxidase